MVPGKYTFMQSNLIDVKMCTFSQEHYILEIKSSSRQWADRQASPVGGLGVACPPCLPPAGGPGVNGITFPTGAKPPCQAALCA